MMALAERVVNVDAGFSTSQVRKIVGVTERQLDYWARTDLLRPSIAEAQGSGTRRRYSYDDLRCLMVVKRLMDCYIPVQQLRPLVSQIRRIDGGDLVILIGSNARVTSDAEFVALLAQRHDSMLTVLSIATVATDLDEAISAATDRPRWCVQCPCVLGGPVTSDACDGECSCHDLGEAL